MTREDFNKLEKIAALNNKFNDDTDKQKLIKYVEKTIMTLGIGTLVKFEDILKDTDIWESIRTSVLDDVNNKITYVKKIFNTYKVYKR